MTPQKTRAVIFDLDGTLVDTMPMYISVYRGIFKDLLGVDVPKKSLKDKFGLEPRRILLSILSEAGLSKDDIDFDSLVEEIRKGISDSVPSIRPHPGVVHLLKRLKGMGLRLAVATLRRHACLEILKASGLEGYFEVIVCGDKVKNPKPDPEIFLTVAEMLGASPSETWVFEDSVTGIRAAKMAGMKVVGVCTGGQSRRELHRENPDILVDSLRGFDVNALAI